MRTRLWRGIPARRRGVLLVTLLLLPIGLTTSSDRAERHPSHPMTLRLGVPLDTLVGAPFEVGGVNGWLVRQQDGTVDAFWARSPHRGCYVDLLQQDDDAYERISDLAGGYPGVFRDVCYGSTFLLTGRRVFGPSYRGLDQF